MAELKVLKGWAKGEELKVSKRKMGSGELLIIEPTYECLGCGVAPCDSIAYMWFYSHKEFNEFMEWWFN